MSFKVITPSMKEFLLEIKKRAVIGIVGGSDLVKMQEQMGAGDGEELCCAAGQYSCTPPCSYQDV